MREMRMWLSRGLVSGAAGTTALYAATYLDMAVRGRPASDTPKQSVQRLSEVLNVPLAGDARAQDARAAGLGSVLGQSVGLSIGLILGGLRDVGWPRTRVGRVGVGWALAMTVGNGPMSVLGVTDPRTWTRSEWLADAIPHLAYAVAATAALDAFER
jgi:hypothetical protein